MISPLLTNSPPNPIPIESVLGFIDQGTPTSQAVKEAEEITPEVVERVANFKNRMVQSQKKVTQKAREVAARTQDIKGLDDANLNGLQGEIKRCCYVDKFMDSVGDFCHVVNDFTRRSSEITDMYLYLDDGLTDEISCHEMKEQIIDRGDGRESKQLAGVCSNGTDRP